MLYLEQHVVHIHCRPLYLVESDRKGGQYFGDSIFENMHISINIYLGYLAKKNSVVTIASVSAIKSKYTDPLFHSESVFVKKQESIPPGWESISGLLDPNRHRLLSILNRYWY